MSISELYAILVLEMHLPPSYILDEIDWYEINSLMKYRYYAVKEQWEQARLITYMTAQVNSKKHLKLTDIITFPWEKDESEENTKVTDDDVKRLKAMADAYLYNEKKMDKQQ